MRFRCCVEIVLKAMETLESSFLVERKAKNLFSLQKRRNLFLIVYSNQNFIIALNFVNVLIQLEVVEKEEKRETFSLSLTHFVSF